MSTTKTVLLGITPNQGYQPSDAETPMTLGDLLAAVQEAIAEWGEDAAVVTFDSQNRYGAAFGTVDQWATFTDADPDGDDDDTAEEQL